jgi:hypothetical protein
VTLAEAIDTITQALEPLQAEIPGLQINGYMNRNPTPPALDIYPSTPFFEPSAMGVTPRKVWWTVRARVSAADAQAASETLLRLLDPSDPASVEAALDGVKIKVGTDGTVSGFTAFTDDQQGDLVGVSWRVGMYV